MVRLPPGSRVDRFEIKSLIGSGGMGTLYLARDTSPNTYRLVALKLLNTNLDSEDLRDRFGREARALASLSHPNVVNIYECGEYRGSPYIVMEYVRGETLAEKIKRKAPLSLPDKLKLMMELCAGLAHAHEAEIIHRDIKPANLMVDHHGRLRLLDFGIARVVETGVTMAGVHMTQIAMRIGTPGYMSPEQYDGAEIDRRSDIFAVGAVFYELLAYREAFPGTTTRQIERRVMESEPERLTSQIPELDPEIEALVNKALQKDPNRRFQDATQMERALTKVWWRLGLAESVSAPRVTPVPVAGSGKKSSRAEAAYQRALSAIGDGAVEAARRFAMEAIAEDSKHEGARRFLEKHDPNFRLPAPSPPPPPPPSDEILEATIVSSRSELNLPVVEMEQTIVSAPGRRRTPAVKPSAREAVSAPPKKKRTGAVGSIWQNYGMAIAVVAVVVAVAGVALLVMSLLGGDDEAGHLLTVTRPANGTIVGDGINCGTQGSDCSESVARESTVALRLLPDEGFAPVGFTENCGPYGQFRMTAERTCGATFTRVTVGPTTTVGPGLADPPNPARHTLTILATEGGVVRVGDVDCRTMRNGCSVPLPAGQLVDLEAQADRGYTFERFTGDCDVDGRVTMTQAHTCGASFVPNPGTVAGTKPPVQTTPPSTQKPQPGRTTAVPQTGAPSGPGGVKPGSGTPAVVTPGATPGGAAPSVGAALPAGPPGSEPKPSGPGEQAPPPPPEVKKPEVEAKEQIDDVLQRYRKANESRSFDAVRAVWPSAYPTVGEMLRNLDEVRYEFAGEAKYEMLDPIKGEALVIQPMKITEIKGREKRQRNTIATFRLTKVNVANRWLIQNVNHKRAD